jgi:TPR repeat protein
MKSIWAGLIALVLMTTAPPFGAHAEGRSDGATLSGLPAFPETTALERGDFTEAERLYRRGAEQGDASAQYNLGFMQFQGWGVRKDYAEAVKWWRKAAEQGDRRAQSNLSAMYANGLGVPQNYVLSYMWAELSAAGGDFFGKIMRKVAGRSLTPDQIAEAKRMAREWLAGRPQLAQPAPTTLGSRAIDLRSLASGPATAAGG